MKFSREKFITLPPLRQLRKIFQLCRQIEQRWWREGEADPSELDMLRQLVDWTTADAPARFLVDDRDAAAFAAGVSALYDSFGYAPDDTDLDIPVTAGRVTRETIPLVVALVNLRSAFNVGGVIRTADCVGATKVVTCGCTPPASHPKVIATSMGAVDCVPCEHYDAPREALLHLRETVGPLVALETGWDDSDIYDVAIPRPCVIVLGNEAQGLDEESLALCDMRVQLPVLGMKNSMNVGVAFGACAYEIYRQWTQAGEGE